jgi:cytochrome P450
MIVEEIPKLPFQRPNVLDLAPEYQVLRSRDPLTKVITRAGDNAWLATRYHIAKELFADERLGRSHPDPANAPRIANSMMFGGPMGDYATERELHALQRKLLVPAFSTRRMKLIAAHVSDLADQLLANLIAQPKPADLHEHLSFPLPITVICELLGVPAVDRGKFGTWSWRFASLTDTELALSAAIEMFEYMGDLVKAKRAQPGDDLISDLIAAAAAGTDLLPDEAIAEMGVSLLFGGHETTVARIDYGTVLLLTHPDQREALRRDPDLLDSAVEEIMRYSAPVDDHFPRYARERIEIAGVTIEAGEAVLLSPSVANRDESVFPEPDRFDISRKFASPHLGFGHGGHYCVGSALGRLELRTVFGKLFHALPALDLAVPFESLQLNEERFTGGLIELPVTW